MVQKENKEQINITKYPQYKSSDARTIELSKNYSLQSTRGTILMDPKERFCISITKETKLNEFSGEERSYYVLKIHGYNGNEVSFGKDSLSRIHGAKVIDDNTIHLTNDYVGEDYIGLSTLPGREVEINSDKKNDFTNEVFEGVSVNINGKRENSKLYAYRTNFAFVNNSGTPEVFMASVTSNYGRSTNDVIVPVTRKAEENLEGIKAEEKNTSYYASFPIEMPDFSDLRKEFLKSNNMTIQSGVIDYGFITKKGKIVGRSSGGELSFFDKEIAEKYASFVRENIEIKDEDVSGIMFSLIANADYADSVKVGDLNLNYIKSGFRSSYDMTLTNSEGIVIASRKVSSHRSTFKVNEEYRSEFEAFKKKLESVIKSEKQTQIKSEDK